MTTEQLIQQALDEGLVDLRDDLPWVKDDGSVEDDFRLRLWLTNNLYRDRLMKYGWGLSLQEAIAHLDNERGFMGRGTEGDPRRADKHLRAALTLLDLMRAKGAID